MTSCLLWCMLWYGVHWYLLELVEEFYPKLIQVWVTRAQWEYVITFLTLVWGYQAFGEALKTWMLKIDCIAKKLHSCNQWWEFNITLWRLRVHLVTFQILLIVGGLQTTYQPYNRNVKCQYEAALKMRKTQRHFKHLWIRIWSWWRRWMHNYEWI